MMGRPLLCAARRCTTAQCMQPSTQSPCWARPLAAPACSLQGCWLGWLEHVMRLTSAFLMPPLDATRYAMVSAGSARVPAKLQRRQAAAQDMPTSTRNRHKAVQNDKLGRRTHPGQVKIGLRAAQRGRHRPRCLPAICKAEYTVNVTAACSLPPPPPPPPPRAPPTPPPSVLPLAPPAPMAPACAARSQRCRHGGVTAAAP